MSKNGKEMPLIYLDKKMQAIAKYSKILKIYILTGFDFMYKKPFPTPLHIYLHVSVVHFKCNLCVCYSQWSETHYSAVKLCSGSPCFSAVLKPETGAILELEFNENP